MVCHCLIIVSSFSSFPLKLWHFYEKAITKRKLEEEHDPSKNCCMKQSCSSSQNLVIETKMYWDPAIVSH